MAFSFTFLFPSTQPPFIEHLNCQGLEKKITQPLITQSLDVKITSLITRADFAFRITPTDRVAAKSESLFRPYETVTMASGVKWNKFVLICLLFQYCIEP